MKRLSWVVGLLALLGSGAYLFVYVYRWEWHRALLVGLLFLASLVALSSGLVLRRLSRLETRLTEARARDDEHRVRQVLREAPVEPTALPWLRPELLDRTSIFIPVLLGAGVVVSGLAWLVERVAGGAARSDVEEELARDLGAIAFPAGPLVPTEVEALAGGTEAVHQPALRLLLGPPTTGGG